MLYIPLYGHQQPHPYRPRYTRCPNSTLIPMTEREKEHYYSQCLTKSHILEPVQTFFEDCLSYDRTYPEPSLSTNRVIHTLPLRRGLIGHRNPLPHSPIDPSTILTQTYLIDGHQAPLYLSQPLRDRPTRYHSPLTHDEFMELIAFWSIPLPAALDFLLWEHIRTDGMPLVHLVHSVLPRTPYVLDWLDRFTSTPVDSSWR